MALTPEKIDAEAFARWGEMKGAPLAMCRGFARAIEAEVRKDDTELIRQLVEALEGYRRNHNDGQPCDAEKAGRARLAPPPPTA